VLLLGPDPVIGAQSVVLASAEHPEHAVRVATDGLRPFAVSTEQP
jgi:general secretion pathway protein H